MLYKNIGLAIRRLRKEKIVNLINILGLSIGITSFLLIVNYLDNETSYDDFHRNGDRILGLKVKSLKIIILPTIGLHHRWVVLQPSGTN